MRGSKIVLGVTLAFRDLSDCSIETRGEPSVRFDVKILQYHGCLITDALVNLPRTSHRGAVAFVAASKKASQVARVKLFG